MGSLVLIPWPETAWSASGRIGGRSPVPLSDAGRDQAENWSRQLAGAGISAVFSGDEQASTETADIVAKSTKARRKVSVGFAEVDAGLWDGLTTEELKRRYPKAYKRWNEDPSAVCPPEGEGITEAFERLSESLEKVMRKQGDRSVAVVLGPLAFAVARCGIEATELHAVRSMMNNRPLAYSLNPDGQAVAPAWQAIGGEEERVDDPTEGSGEDDAG